MPFIVLLVVCSVPVLAADADSAPQAPPDSLLPRLPTAEDIGEGIAEAERSEADTADALRTTRAEDERTRSKTAYLDSTASEAQLLLNREFTDVLSARDSDPGRAITDVELQDAYGPSVGRVKVGGRPALVDAGIPLRTRDESGSLNQVDLTLEATKAGFRPVNPLVPLLIPTDAEQPVVLGGELSVRPDTDKIGNAGQAFGEKDRFFSEVLPDTDLLVSPVASGVEFAWQLRSPSSPEGLRLDLQLPAKHGLRLDGVGGADILVDDRVAFHLDPPTALDAQGTPIRATLVADGGSVIVSVPHRKQDLAYPIYVDPLLQDWITDGSGNWNRSWYHGYNLSALTDSSWYWQTNTNWIYGSTTPIYRNFGGSGRGLHMSSSPSAQYRGANNFGQWVYPAPGGPDSFVSAVTLWPFWRDNHACPRSSYSQPHDYSGIWSPVHGWVPLHMDDANDHGISQMQNSDPTGDAFVVGLGSNLLNPQPPIPCWRDIYAGGASFFLEDSRGPTWNEGQTSSGVVGPWASSGSVPVSLSARDDGLGVKFYILFRPDGSGGLVPLSSSAHPCTGVKPTPCPLDGWSVALNASVDALPEGVNGLTAYAYDPLFFGNHATPARDVKVRVDRSQPSSLDVTGEMRDPGDPGVHLDVEARDGDPSSPATTRSGVKEISVIMDDDPNNPSDSFEVLYHDVMNCIEAWGSCPSPLVRNLQLPYQKVAGTHTFRVEVTDQAGHLRSTETWTETTPLEEATRLAAGDPLDESRAAEAEGQCGRATASGVKVRHGVLRGTNGANLIVAARYKGFRVIRGYGGCDVIHGGPGGQLVRGDAGDDLIFGDRGNDNLFGGPGADRIYGGVGDDLKMRGGEGADLLVGGQGQDVIFGQEGDDLIRGGATIDTLLGGGGMDTLSYADAVSPGFKDSGAATSNLVAGFPPQGDGQERGVFVDLRQDSQARAQNGNAYYGGGNDKLFKYTPPDPNGERTLIPGSFERVVGSAFSDLILGSSGYEHIDAGPGADVVRGGDGGDLIYGGTDDDYLEGIGATFEGGPGSDSCSGGCERTDPSVTPRPTEKISVGLVQPDDTAPLLPQSDFFVVGSDADDDLRIRFNDESNSLAITALNQATGNRFDEAQDGGCNFVTVGQSLRRAICPLVGPFGSLVVSGGKGADKLVVAALPKPVSAQLLGGADPDELTGNQFEQTLADGPAQGTGATERLHAGSGDDVLLNNGGADILDAAQGNDLIVSRAICDGDTVNGGQGRDNSSWTQMRDVSFGVWAIVGTGLGQKVDGGVQPTCPDRGLDDLIGVEELEGSPQHDVLVGNAADNVLLGRGGYDSFDGGAGSDLIVANDDAADGPIVCGPDHDPLPVVDRRKNGREVDSQIGVSCEKKGSKQVRHKAAGYMERIVPLGDTAPMSELTPEEEEDPEPPGIDDLVINGADVQDESDSTSPLAFYRLDETSGAVAADSSGELDDVDGRYLGHGDPTGPSLGLPGAMIDEESSAVRLDGQNDYVDLGQNWDPNDYSSPGFSIEMWVKFNGPPTVPEHLLTRSNGTQGIYLYRRADGTLVFSTRIAAGSPTVETGEPLVDDAWHHVVGTLDGSTIALYVDGFGYALGYGQSVFPGQTPNASTLIGVGDSWQGWASADIDDVSIYDEALNEDDIAVHLGISNAEEASRFLEEREDPADTDSDDIIDEIDNCVDVANPDQVDTDFNGLGNACDPGDGEGDGIADVLDNCIDIYNPGQEDSDLDGIGEACAMFEDEGGSLRSTGGSAPAKLDK